MKASTPTESSPAGAGSISRRLLLGYLVVLAALYLVQALSPLRINTDAYRLLSMAVSAHEGSGYLVDGKVDLFPLGYPFIVRALLEAKLATSMALVLINLAGLVIGLWAFSRCHDSRHGTGSALLVTTLVLSSWVMIKHVALPLSEFVYFATSSLSILSLCGFYRREGRTKWWWWVLSAVLAYTALQCRSVGLTLFPALILSVILHRDLAPLLNDARSRWRPVVALASAIAVLLLVAAVMVRRTEWYETQFARAGGYFQGAVDLVGGRGILATVLQNASFRIVEFGELFTNVPRSKASWLLPLLYAVGAGAWLLVARGAWLLLRTRELRPPMMYLLTYCALILVWPYRDTRFWLPVLPLMAVAFLAALRELSERWPRVRQVSRAYLVSFFFLGLVALGFSTRISLSGRDIGERFGEGIGRTELLMTYRYAFQNGKPVDRSKVSENMVRLLRIFDPRARTTGVVDGDDGGPSTP